MYDNETLPIFLKLSFWCNGKVSGSYYAHMVGYVFAFGANVENHTIIWLKCEKSNFWYDNPVSPIFTF